MSKPGRSRFGWFLFQLLPDFAITMIALTHGMLVVLGSARGWTITDETPDSCKEEVGE